jgi:histidine triad (HIT) family protein
LGHLLLVAGKVASELGFNSVEEGFRLVINNGRYGGEAVPHLHVHLLSGRELGWPPG